MISNGVSAKRLRFPLLRCILTLNVQLPAILEGVRLHVRVVRLARQIFARIGSVQHDGQCACGLVAVGRRLPRGNVANRGQNVTVAGVGNKAG